MNVMTRKFGIPDALQSLVPGSQWSVVGNTYAGINWLSDDLELPSEEAVLAEIKRLQDEYDALEYARARAVEYPSIGDQLDALFKAGVFPAEMAAQLQAVKDKYPKG